MKSKRAVHAEGPVPSVALSHQWNIDISACVVDEPGMKPYWAGSIDCKTVGLRNWRSSWPIILARRHWLFYRKRAISFISPSPLDNIGCFRFLKILPGVGGPSHCSEFVGKEPWYGCFCRRKWKENWKVRTHQNKVGKGECPQNKCFGQDCRASHFTIFTHHYKQ